MEGEPPELQDWNAYAETLQQRATVRLLALALREVLEGRRLTGLQVLKAVLSVDGAMGKEEFTVPLQRLLAAKPDEIRQELELLKEERGIGEYLFPLTGRR